MTAKWAPVVARSAQGLIQSDLTHSKVARVSNVHIPSWAQEYAHRAAAYLAPDRVTSIARGLHGLDTCANNGVYHARLCIDPSDDTIVGVCNVNVTSAVQLDVSGVPNSGITCRSGVKWQKYNVSTDLRQG